MISYGNSHSSSIQWITECHYCGRVSSSSGTQEEGDSVTAWGPEGLMEYENSLLCCSGEARIAGRHS